MKVIQTTFLGESVTTRSNIFVRFARSQGIADQKKLSNFIKLGRIPSESLKGWLRNAFEYVLLKHGISVCHPLPANTITADRNKEAYKKDLELGYHPRGDCKSEGGCLLLRLFGDLDLPGNLIVPSVYFYPANGGAITKNHSKLFGTIGTGRLELTNDSPRVRHNGHQPYLTTETTIGTTIQAPLKLILRENDESQEIVLLKTLEFLHKKLTGDNYEFKFMLAGKRTRGYGRAALVFLNESGNYVTKSRNVLGIKNDEAEIINKKFKKIIRDERDLFPIKKSDDSKEDK